MNVEAKYRFIHANYNDIVVYLMANRRHPMPSIPSAEVYQDVESPNVIEGVHVVYNVITNT